MPWETSEDGRRLLTLIRVSSRALAGERRRHQCRSSRDRPTPSTVREQADLMIHSGESSRAPSRTGERRDWLWLRPAVAPRHETELEAPALHAILRGLGQPKSRPL